MASFDSLLRDASLPRLEARLLLEAASGLSRAQLIARGDAEAPADVAAAFRTLAEARLRGEPIAYLVGEREFYGRPFRVAPGVLIPRPETEHLVEAALARVGRDRRCKVVDLGTGSGIVAVTLALEAPAWRVSAGDVSPDALAIARDNAARLLAPVQFFEGSWYEALPTGERYDLIVSNPPYIAAGDGHLDQGDLRFEPRGALTDEADGLACLRTLADGAAGRLLPGGWLMVEHGYDQGDAVRALFVAAGLASVQTLADLAGLDRVTLGQRGEP
ncbi:peptide chain release factor N(5)-glutamine methyltransferase [Crenobacter cavernae]|uniref:Release factor glutamine methyltransferase n=1 Tax=Crenobacter cavernae TaxID=2290923 RepID=A0ABY0FHS7_9NEIS|nr:peptide chain release factor N(5)-glutamine methyltransferase [Crenobacter cavernae]RXZ44991.1 peptide chain release factor N(5)-glutamine methyltransferase [Crenobacter cavernae]